MQRQKCCKLKRICKKDQQLKQPSLDIYQLANNPTAAGIMPVFCNVATTLKRKRRAMFPALPISRQLLVVPAIYQVRDIKLNMCLKGGCTQVLSKMDALF